ncbi:MAG: hypothetical protein GY870_04680 [archaeon]|nr:hypothetical protein [archaeon]
MEIKYTGDGKKVKVISKINNQETVVQEIFLDGKKETPSGEQFVVKTLHDKPLLSWKEERIKQIDAHFKYMEQKFETKKKQYDKEVRTINHLLTSLKVFQKYFNQDKLKNLDLFLSGEIKYLLKIDHWKYSIVEFTKEIMDQEDWIAELKLLTLYGKSNGDLTWRLNQYYDGSGSDIKIIPCTSIEEAEQELQKHVDSKINKHGKIESEEYKAYKEYGIHINENYINEYIQTRIKECEKSIIKIKEDTQKRINKEEIKIKEYNNI